MSVAVAVIKDINEKLTKKLNEESVALPKGFNSFRFKQNAMCAIQNLDFSRINQGETNNLVRCILQGAYLGLDFMSKECYIVPRSGKPTFMTDYKGEKKLCYEYAVRPIRNIYAEVVKKGDELNISVVDNKTIVNFNPDPFNDNPIIGAFAVVEYEDGTINTERMSVKEIEKVREKSLAKKSGPWFDSYGEMCKKTVIRRLTKHIQLKFNDKQLEAWNEGSQMDFEKKPKTVQEAASDLKDKMEEETQEDNVIDVPFDDVDMTDTPFEGGE